MLSSKRQLKSLVVFTLAGALFLTGCAKKSYVKKTVDDKVAPLDKKVTDLGAATKDNAERIDAVDRRATQGITAAATAQTAAGAADTKATQAGAAAATAQTAATGAQRTADTATQGVTAANTRIGTVENRINNLPIDRYTAGPVEMVMFKVGSSKLSEDAMKTLDGIASPVANLPGGYQIEIQGFASSEGAETANILLSQQRAESVQRYLVSKGVALIRISIVGLGVDKPVGDNKTKAGREQNRRVEVRTFRLPA